LCRSSTRGPEDDSVESKHVTPLSHYMFNVTTVVFDRPSPPFYITNTSRWNTSSSETSLVLISFVYCRVYKFEAQTETI